jgi:hypothetical protein
MTTVLSSALVTMSDAMAGLSVRLVKLSVSIQTAIHSVIGVKRVHRLALKPAPRRELPMSVRRVMPV